MAQFNPSRRNAAQSRKGAPMTEQATQDSVQEPVQEGTPSDQTAQDLAQSDEMTSAPVVQESQETLAEEIVEEAKAAFQFPVALSDQALALLTRIGETNQFDLAHLQKIMEYMVKMAPGIPVNEQVGATHQVEFFRALRSLLETDGEQWKRIFAVLLMIIEQYSGPGMVFSEAYVFRFLEYMKLAPAEIKLFKVILNMLSILAPIEGRKDNAKQFSIERTFAAGLSEGCKSRVMDFLGLQ